MSWPPDHTRFGSDYVKQPPDRYVYRLWWGKFFISATAWGIRLSIGWLRPPVSVGRYPLRRKSS